MKNCLSFVKSTINYLQLKTLSFILELSTCRSQPRDTKTFLHPIVCIRAEHVQWPEKKRWTFFRCRTSWNVIMHSQIVIADEVPSLLIESFAIDHGFIGYPKGRNVERALGPSCPCFMCIPILIITINIESFLGCHISHSLGLYLLHQI